MLVRRIFLEGFRNYETAEAANTQTAATRSY